MKTKSQSPCDALDLGRTTIASIGAALVLTFTLALSVPGSLGQTGWGNALWLDGLDDHVSVNSGVNLANTSFTLEFRSKQVGISGFQVVVSQGPAEGLHIGFNDGNRATFRLWADDLDASISADWLWHHWAFTYSAPDRVRKIFRDGVEVASDTVQVDYPGSGPLLLGRYASDPAYSFAGILDDFRIWSVARSQADIAAGMKVPLTGTEPDLVAYWNFDEGTGATVHDATTNGHTGTISSDPEWMRTTPGGHVLSVSNVNQYIQVSIPRLASNYTFSAWVFLRAGGSSSSFPVGVLSAQPSGASAEVLIHGWTGAPATAPQYLHLSRSGAFSGPDSGLRVPTNQWVHVAVTVDPSKQVTYFIDGLVASSWDGSGKDLSIGPSINLADNTGRRFNGLLDEVQIWNIARPQVDVVADYIHPRTGTDPNLLASYRFDEGAGSAVYDGVASFPEGALINGPAWIWQSTTVPYPVSLPASGVSLSAAVLHGLVNPNGLETAAWFDWGTTTSYENSTAPTNVGSGSASVPISDTLDALMIGTTYHYRAVGSNNLGVAYGADRTFNILLVTNSSGPGSLRQIIAEAVGGDIIVVTNHGVTGWPTEQVIDKDLSIVGPGASNLAIFSFGNGRVLNIRSNIMVRISGLTLQGGHAPDGAWGTTAGAPGLPGEHGGGIYNAGHLTLNECVLADNSAGSGGVGYGDENASRPVNGGNGNNGGAGGSGGSGGGIYNAESGVLWLEGCTITQNRSGPGGHGGFGERGGDSEGVPGAGGTGGAGGHGGSGAGLLNHGQATLKDCTMSDNSAGQGGSGYRGGRGGNNLPNWLGIYLHWGGNGGYGGTGGSGGSGGSLAGNGQTTLINCTLSGNEAGSANPGGNGGGGGSSGGLASWGHVGGGGNGGDGGTGGGIFNSGSLELLSCTIVDNATGLGAAGGLASTSGTSGGGPGAPGDDGIAGGIHNVSAPAASMANTVVALNAGASYPNVAGAFAYHGQNWIGGDPLLGPLANNGGPTWTREPHPTSPLINAGHNRGAPDTDQRGLPRIAGGTIDIGACEYQSPQSIISYAWLKQNGLPTDGSADFQDPDGDLMNNWQEWRCGTYPQYDASVLRMLTPSRTGDGVIVSWECVYNRTYFLQRATNLGEPPSFLTLATNLSGEWDTISYTDTNTVGTSFYYRVGVEE